MDVTPSIFRDYDIRGVYPVDLNEETIYRLSLAIGTYYHERGAGRVSVGRDCRLSSPALSRRLMRGLVESGISVVDLGMVPTPLLYFSLHHLDVDGGIEVTGSHNPPEYNGLKICIGDGAVHGDEIRKIRKILESGKFIRTPGGELLRANIVRSYQDRLLADINPGPARLRVVVDAGNGVGGEISVNAYRAMGFEVIPLFCEPDGAFPNHYPDPAVPGNLQILRSKVLESSADLGIAFDSDADRLGVVDRDGAIVWGDELMIVFSRNLLSRCPGAAVIGEVKCSQVMYDDIESHGGKAIMWKTGHSNLRSKMKEEGALLAGEMSGHFFFADRYYGYCDAVYAGARLLEILSRTGKGLKDLLNGVPNIVNTPEIRLDCPDEKKFRIVTKLVKDFKKDHRVIDVDGARVLFESGWGLVRASNTEPMLVLRFEATNEVNLHATQNALWSRLRPLL